MIDLSSIDLSGLNDIRYGWTLALGAGLSALSSLFGSNKKTVETSSQGTSSTTPQYDSNMAAMKNYIMSQLQGQLEGDVTGDYITQGVKKISSGSEGLKRRLSANLAARGLSSSPLAATAENVADEQRNADIVNLMSSKGLLDYQLKSGALSNLSSFFSSLPVATSTSTSGSQSQTGTSGTSLSGALDPLSQALAAYYGMQKKK
jgi:hypothetical protein